MGGASARERVGERHERGSQQRGRDERRSRIGAHEPPHDMGHDEADEADDARERDGCRREQRRSGEHEPLRARDVDADRACDGRAQAQGVERRNGERREHQRDGRVGERCQEFGVAARCKRARKPRQNRVATAAP